ncbi:MAG TPA: ABC transporter ATP-binding protein, partial [Devosia sp.]
MAAIEIRNLNKAYGKTRVLHDISLDIADNSFVVFVGPSGCGKSTLLRTIAGLEEKETGTIKLDGRDISDDAPVDRDVAMVFQSYALYPQMTVAENIGFALSVAKTDKKVIAGKVRDVSHLLRLDELLERKPAHLSGGQRQRVAIGRAIVRQPKA